MSAGAAAQPLRRRPRVAVVASLTSSLVNFRYELLQALAEQAEVMACAPDHDPETEQALAGAGVGFTRIPMARAGMNPLQDLGTLAALRSTFRAFRPDIVLPYTMKPIIYGGLAARMAGVPQRFALCTGLGYVFVPGGGLRKRLLRGLSVQLYRQALKGARGVFVYNRADAGEFRRNRLTGPGTWLGTVPGSGVNLERFAPLPLPPGPPVFLMIARLLRDKGVREFAEAARRLKARCPEARCQLLGPVDPNPAAIAQAELDSWVAEGILEYLGETRDVRPYLAGCTVFVLPSYREGISRTVLEAMAAGRAVVTSDAPGCADPVDDGVTGFVTPVRDPAPLAAAMERFVLDPGLAARMGAAARSRAETVYSVGQVNALLLAGLGLAPGDPPRADP
jgi:glycosyltransferase involved in cell wall biosynthesis